MRCSEEIVRTLFHLKKDVKGVVLAVSRDILAVSHSSWNSDEEDLWITLLKSNRKIHLCCVHVPPDDDFAKMCFTNNIERIADEFADDIVSICGDFNLLSVERSQNGANCLSPSNVNNNSSTIIDSLSSCELLQFNHITIITI
ncbi:hypothetical protein JTB14_023279 [Gonioctena quinquepunctata]|nr:hypothetical protein JTB14_023279 [Gonioctena quinquepunctata]